MSWNIPLLKPAPHIPRRPEAEVKKLYPKLRWQILESTFIGYAIFYLVRNNLPVVSKEIGQSLSYSKGQIGDLLAITAICYGLGKFIMGAWSDRSNPRYFMPLGLLLTAGCNFAFASAHSYPVHLFLWGLNGLVQSMGWAPCGRSLGHWYSISERGTKFAFWNVAQNVGGGLTGLIVAYTTSLWGWQSAFYVPGILAVICAIYLLWRLRDTPQSIGLPPIEEYRNDYPAGKASAEDEKELGTKELFVNYILLNRYVWLFAFANFFAYIARYSMLDWGPTYLKEVKHASLSAGGGSTAALEFSAIFSSILVGWLSDKFGGRRGMISMLCMVPVLAAYGAIIYLPHTDLWVDMVLFGVIGFFVYPTVLLLVVSALDFTSKKAVGTAAGFIGMFGYLGRVAEGKGIGYLAERFGWNTALNAVMICTLGAVVLLSLTWNLTPKQAQAQKEASKNRQRFFDARADSRGRFVFFQAALRFFGPGIDFEKVIQPDWAIEVESRDRRMRDKSKTESAESDRQGAPKPPLRQPSIKDIAKLAQVSHPTVSRALQNSPLVNAKTAEKIRRIAREAGYRPSAVARGLVTRRTRTIGLVVTSVSDPFTGEVVSGIEQSASDHGYCVYLADSNADPQREKKAVQAFAEQRVDGIIVTSSRVGALHLPLLTEMQVPVVLVNDQYPGTVAHSVLICNEDGTRMLTEHLLQLGHKRIAYIGDKSGYQSDTERLSGFNSALEAVHISLHKELVAYGDGKPAAAFEAMNALLDLPEPPTAVCCYNDMTALGAMRAIRLRGLRIPEDLSVVGFDDLFVASYTEPPLTTIHQPMRRMGQLAMESLVRLMAGEVSVPMIRVPAEIVIRKSTAAVRK